MGAAQDQWLRGMIESEQPAQFTMTNGEILLGMVLGYDRWSIVILRPGAHAATLIFKHGVQRIEAGVMIG